MSLLFSPLKIKSIEFKNRIFVSPMCQYSCLDGVPNDWHLVHLGSRAVGGAALVIAEATAVSPEGRISLGDTGLWNFEQEEAYKKITAFIKAQDSVAGIQLAHAGRKASTRAPWQEGAALSANEGGWFPVAPSPLPFSERSPTPLELDSKGLQKVVDDFTSAARRSVAAGFEVVELHMAHGYLLHEFLSPLSNHRTDEYGGHLENRMRFPLQVAKAVRSAWPIHLPLFARISVTDWVAGGWTPTDSAIFARELKLLGIDLIDCSSGGNVSKASIPASPGYQVPLSEKIKQEANIKTGAVGLITDPHQAEAILQKEQADAIFLARAFLYDPYWPLHAAEALKDKPQWPKQYERIQKK